MTESMNRVDSDAEMAVDSFKDHEGPTTIELSPSGTEQTASGPSATHMIHDMAQGVIFASLAVTDNKEKTLKRVGKTNPWHIEALKLISGSEETAHQPLTALLEQQGLVLDTEIDESGITGGGHFLDTQGYIAHNDEMVVVSFRCSTSAFDWLTNLNMTTSQWEIEEDMEQGYSGTCSGFEGLCFTDDYKPRVHTGFYNNFLASLPLIQKYVEPLIGADQPPRKVFVCGHSLGAGIATLASCYMALQFDWDTIPQKLVSVTAGGPRACAQSMKEVIEERLAHFSDGNVEFYRVVRGKDVVVSVPPAMFGFRHITPAITIDKKDRIILPNSLARDVSEHDVDPGEFLELMIRSEGVQDEAAFEAEQAADQDESREAVQETTEEKKARKYQKFMKNIPSSLRDHCPDFYLRPLLKARCELPQEVDDAPEPEQEDAIVDNAAKPPMERKKKRRFRGLFRRRKPAVANQ